MDNPISEELQVLYHFIESEKGMCVFLHTTNSIEKVHSILEQGFRFNQFSKSTDQVCDEVSLKYMLNIRRHYGQYTLIILIPDSIKDIGILCNMSKDEEGETVYTLPPQYIKGYYCRKTHAIEINPFFWKF